MSQSVSTSQPCRIRLSHFVSSEILTLTVGGRDAQAHESFAAWASSDLDLEGALISVSSPPGLIPFVLASLTITSTALTFTAPRFQGEKEKEAGYVVPSLGASLYLWAEERTAFADLTFTSNVSKSGAVVEFALGASGGFQVLQQSQVKEFKWPTR
ncbi:hypothetical protein WKR88_26115 [Trinickia caryophylli]|uniref:Uncharacterized protein n=1 Tax=Trinickia caryophylli TaxID=28094 RepID=A0A1X7GAZ0_TRICW|nr:hypothetical protein [Trinickia caryophylli]TRX17558.1 hypothetical protein FNF07_04485 [Trinickia caryophylli]WQE11692.1 hypothetical protein U0034_18425 [Trinickia caryophylli]GLU34878.1 hypothetical protein Busp01_47200 [Trinickia caryophylli]SMF66517.1 hypothetical protein SAMN06295900_114125 [Trinickia caryophylli]